MRCTKAQQLLQAYIDKRLTLEQIRMLEVHLATCDSCKQELLVLEEIELSIRSMGFVAEPPDLTSAIMLRVAVTPQIPRGQYYDMFRPSWREMLTIVVLATVTTLSIILVQPSLRQVLPVHDMGNMFVSATTHIALMLAAINVETLTWMLWIVGTILGIWITLILAGNEVRSLWFKAVMDRLPVW